jgi:hypothetical protein
LVNTLASLFSELSTGVSLYPTYNESHRDCQKLHVIEDFDEIAEMVTKTPRPKTSLHRDEIPQVEGLKVVKRSGSADSKHVYPLHPGQRPPPTFSLHHFYFYQEYVPALRSRGEARVIICNGKDVVCRIATLPSKDWEDDELKFWEIQHIRPLSAYGENE